MSRPEGRVELGLRAISQTWISLEYRSPKAGHTSWERRCLPDGVCGLSNSESIISITKSNPKQSAGVETGQRSKRFGGGTESEFSAARKHPD